MKNISILVMVVAMMNLLIACGGGDQTSGNDTENTANTDNKASSVQDKVAKNWTIMKVFHPGTDESGEAAAPNSYFNLNTDGSYETNQYGDVVKGTWVINEKPADSDFGEHPVGLKDNEIMVTLTNPSLDYKQNYLVKIDGSKAMFTATFDFTAFEAEAK